MSAELLNALVKAMNKQLPDCSFQVNEAEGILTIPARCQDFGPIEIQDDFDELTIIIGKFTHWHLGHYDDDLHAKDRADAIANEAVGFLKRLFADEVIAWGSHKRGGGFYYRGEKPNSKSLFGKKKQEWVWSGAFSS